jgi:hypothetical protein
MRRKSDLAHRVEKYRVVFCRLSLHTSTLVLIMEGA